MLRRGQTIFAIASLGLMACGPTRPPVVPPDAGPPRDAGLDGGVDGGAAPDAGRDVDAGPAAGCTAGEARQVARGAIRDVALAVSGEVAVVVWAEERGGTVDLHRRTVSMEGLGEPGPLTDDAPTELSLSAVGDADGSWVAWTSAPGPELSGFDVSAARLGTEGLPTTATETYDLADGVGDHLPSLVATPTGAHVVWVSQLAAGGAPLMRRRGPLTDSPAPADVRDDASPSTQIRAAAFADGLAWAWHDVTPSQNRVAAMVESLATGARGPILTLSESSEPMGPVTLAALGDRAAAVWETRVGPDRRPELRFRAFDGDGLIMASRSVTPGADHGRAPSLLGLAGGWVGLWQGGPSERPTVRVSLLDASGNIVDWTDVVDVEGVLQRTELAGSLPRLFAVWLDRTGGEASVHVLTLECGS